LCDRSWAEGVTAPYQYCTLCAPNTDVDKWLERLRRVRPRRWVLYRCAALLGPKAYLEAAYALGAPWLQRAGGRGGLEPVYREGWRDGRQRRRNWPPDVYPVPEVT
jgi:hypothetical protein